MYNLGQQRRFAEFNLLICDQPPTWNAQSGNAGMTKRLSQEDYEI